MEKLKTEMCKYTTSLQEVNGVSFRVMKILCKRGNTDTTQTGSEGMDSNIAAYKARFKLKFPTGWDLTKNMYVAVASVSITGIPCFNQDFIFIGGTASMSCCPRSFAIRSNALGAAGNILEAKRYRGQITGIDVRRLTSGLTNPAPAAVPYSSTEFLGIQTGQAPPPYNLPPDLDEIPVVQSNILQLIPNDFNMNFKNDYLSSEGEVGFNYQTMYYGVFWKKAVKLGTSGLRLPMDNAQTIFDLYITANYDRESIPPSQTGVGVHQQNLTYQFQGNSLNYNCPPTAGYADAGVGHFYPEMLLSTGVNIGTSATHDRAGWNVELVVYQLEN